MALKLSTAAVNFITGRGSFRSLLADNLLGIWSGTAPASADEAAGGSLLCIVSKASGSTYLKPTYGEVVNVLVTGVGAGVTYSFDVTIGAETLLVTATYTNTPTGDAKTIACKLVRLFEAVGLKACSTGTDGNVNVMAPPGLALTVALHAGSTGAVTITDAEIAADTTGECLNFGPALVGVISKTSAVWSGTNLLTGVAGYFRFYWVGDDHAADSLALGWIKPRVQGAISTSGVEGSFSNTTLTAGATLTIGNCDLTLPLST
jgi:hypothetical protein